MRSAQHYSHFLLQECVTHGDHVIDATAGNGHDTVFLAQLVGDSGHVYAFDIQQEAIQATQKRAISLGLHHISYFVASHASISNYIADTIPIKGAIFNLGYLPGSDKSIITRATSTIQAIQAILPTLSKKGRIVIVSYYGHEGGIEEKNALISFLSSLPQKEWSVLQYQFINQVHSPPICFCIEKQ